MERATSLLVFLALCLTFPPDTLAASSPLGGAKNQPDAAPAVLTTIREKPFIFTVTHKGDKVVLRLDRAPAKVEILSRTTSLYTDRTKGKTDFDLTPFVPKAHRGTLLVKAWTVKGSLFQEIVQVAAPPPLTAPAARSVVPVTPAATMRKDAVAAPRMTMTIAPAAATVPGKERAATQPRATMSAASGLTRKLGRAVPKGSGESGAFEMIVPRRGEYYHFGQSLTVHWINNGGEACAGRGGFAITLRADADAGVNFTLFEGRVAETGEAVVQIPRAGMIPERHDYYVHVEKGSADECWADSWSFSVGPIREGSGEWVGVPPEVRFLAPRVGDVLPYRGAIITRWRLFPLTIPYLNFTVTVVDAASGDLVIGPLGEGMNLPFDNETRVYSAGYSIGPDPGRYRVRVRAERQPGIAEAFIEGESAAFTVAAAEVPLTPGAIRLLTPDPAASGNTLYVTRVAHISWDYPLGNDAGHGWTVKLMRDGRLHRVLGSGRPGGTSLDWRVGSTGAGIACDDESLAEVFRAERGGGFSIRVESSVEPERLFAESGLFDIALPDIDVTSPAAGETWANGASRTIRWQSGRLAGELSVWIVLERGLMMGVETDCIARNYRWNAGTAGTYRLDVGNYACVDYSVASGPEGVGLEYGVGTMGGVPPPTGDTFRVRIRVEECPDIEGISPGDFTITP